MHPLIHADMVSSIRETGKAFRSLPDREAILQQHNLPCDQPAQNVIISGCQMLSVLGEMLASLGRILEHRGFSYTFLSKEYCCGNMLYRPAIKARDEEAIAECRVLSKEFVAKNLQQARDLGARRVVIFCSPCYPIYRHAFPQEEIVFYPRLLAEAMGEVQFEESIDYYPGCYRLNQRFSSVDMDLESTETVMEQLPGLRVRRIGAPKCCYTPEGLSHMLESIRSRILLHICTGCYLQALKHLPDDKDTEVIMLPQLVERAMELNVRPAP
jgi:hypothetical protein